MVVMMETWFKPSMAGPHFTPPAITLSKEEDDNYWNLTVREIWWDPFQPSLQNVWYYHTDRNWTRSENGLLSNITDKPSGYNVTFLDNDRDNTVSVNDTIRISRSGGPKGAIKTGDRICLRVEEYIVEEVWL